jgi:replicative DNA helicase
MDEKKELINAAERIKDVDVTAIGDDNFQIKLVKLIIENKEKFPEQIIDIVKAEYFDNTYIKILMDYVIRHVNSSKGNMIPDFDTLKSIITNKQQAGIQRTKLLETIDSIKDCKITDREYIQNTALEFCRKQSVKNGIIQAADLWSTGDYDEIVRIITDSLKAGEPKHGGHDYVEDVAKRLVKEHRLPVTAISGLDGEMGGGLAGGELGVVLSPTGGGKSMMLVKFTANAFSKKKNVVYYTLELSEKMIGNRLDSCLFNLSLSDITDYADVITERIQKDKKNYGRIFIKEFPTGTATVNTIRNHIKTLERDFAFTPDVIMIDYADIMKSMSTYQEKRHNLTNIYEGLRGLAMELNTPIWTCSQANRDAINSESFDLRTISESLGKAQTADVIVGLARTDQDKRNKKATMMILKNRLGRDGISIPLYFDTAKIDIQPLDDARSSGLMSHANEVEREAAQFGTFFGDMEN